MTNVTEDGDSGINAHNCLNCGFSHQSGSPCKVKLCVITTPEEGFDEFVSAVSVNQNGKFPYDARLSHRVKYLPVNHIFSVKIYDDQYLHIHQGCVDGTCSCLHFLDGVPNKMKPCRVAATMLINGFWSRDDLFVLTGLCRGFKILDGSPDISYEIPNYKSILQKEARLKMNGNINEELFRGTISPSHTIPRCVHALGAIIRPDGRIRPITDCSEPTSSINDFMWQSAPRFSFSNVHDTGALVSEGGYGAVTDISNAYRNILIFPPHREYVGFSWGVTEKKYYKDNALCFGLKSAPSIFNAISSFVTRVMVHNGVATVGYLDDYFVASGSEEGCHTHQRTLIAFLEHIGFKVNYTKVAPPSTSPRFLGIDIDLVNMVFKLPDDKLQKARTAVRMMQKKKFTTRKDLERLTGYLAHCAILVKGGRTFCRRLYSLLKATKNVRKVKLSAEVRLDLNWWDAFLELFNGTCQINDSFSPIYEVFTDASNTGFGGWWDEKFFFGHWAPVKGGCNHRADPPSLTELSHSSINVKELWPVIEAIHRWGNLWKNCNILLHSDNTQVLAMVATGRSVNKQAMSLLRELFWQCAILNITIRAVHIPTAENLLADRLSRLPIDVFSSSTFGLPIEFNVCCINSGDGVLKEKVFASEIPDMG